jgi:hypothetical protein
MESIVLKFLLHYYWKVNFKIKNFIFFNHSPQVKLNLTNLSTFENSKQVGKISKFNYEPILEQSKGENENVQELLLVTLGGKQFKLSNHFVEWFVGFSDAESSFSFILHDRKYKTSKISPFSAEFMFKLTLHQDDISVLNYIKNKLHCGRISSVKDGSNIYVSFIISDRNSINNIIIPIFDFFKLNSSKYIAFNMWKEAFLIYHNAKKIKYLDLGEFKLSLDDQQKMLNLKNELTKFYENASLFKDKVKTHIITKYWLLGFIL